MTDKKPVARRAARTKSMAVRMHKREERFVQGQGSKSFDRSRAARRRRHKLEAHGIIICMELLVREGLSEIQMRRLANTLRGAGFVALIDRPDSIKLEGEPGLSMAFMARADMRGVLGRRFRRDLGRIFRDGKLIRPELKAHVKKRLARVFPSIASVEPPRKG